MLTAMQISAANLLLAAQQTRPAASALAGAASGAKAAAKSFSLPDLDAAADTAEKPAETPGNDAPKAPAAPAPVARTRGYAAVAAPGSTLDISV